MQRKTNQETCERLRHLDTEALRRQCARFVLDHASSIAAAEPQLPRSLNDRAADIWEPLFTLADLAGGAWPELARNAAIHLSGGSQDTSPIGSLLLDIFIAFTSMKIDRIFTRDLVATLNSSRRAAWSDALSGKEVTERWLAAQLRPFDIKPRTVWIDDVQAKGYFLEELQEVCRRYVTQSEWEALKAEWRAWKRPAQDTAQKPAPKSAPW